VRSLSSAPPQPQAFPKQPPPPTLRLSSHLLSSQSHFLIIGRCARHSHVTSTSAFTFAFPLFYLRQHTTTNPRLSLSPVPDNSPLPVWIAVRVSSTACLSAFVRLQTQFTRIKMPSVYDFHHIELDGVGRGKKR
jgi:hypothetical protein